ncbi:MAG: hypothetical protein LBF25_03035 [Puniceicoccales bacterium]|nr:hypothetical protein [Puniceicoccales bacterium]
MESNNISFVSPVVAQASVSASENNLAERPVSLRNRPSGEEIRVPKDKEVVSPTLLVDRESNFSTSNSDEIIYLKIGRSFRGA